MRVVKLNPRYILGQYGFTHALRFDGKGKDYYAIKKALEQLYADEQPWSQWWRQSTTNSPWGLYKNPKSPKSPSWIGVRRPADLTAAILMAQTNDV